MTEEPLYGLLLLLGAGLVGLWGLWILQREAARRASITGYEPARGGSRLGRALDRRLRATGPGGRLAIRLESAGIERSPLGFVLLTSALAFLMYLVAGLLLPKVMAVMAALGVLGGAALWIDRKREARKFAFVAQLPEIARLLSGGASAGLAMPQAMELAASELEEPAGPELGRAVSEMRLGMPLADALEGLARRMPSRELSVLMTTLVIQQRAGGDVVRALQELAETLEARQETLREVRTLMSGAVFSSYLVAGLGVLTIVMMSTFGGDVLDQFTRTAGGIAILALATSLYGIGFLLIRQTTRIEV